MKHAALDSIRVSAGEIARNFGQWQDRALLQPVVVTHHGRPRVVIVSAEDYATLDSEAAVAETAGSTSAERRIAALLDNLTGGFFALDVDLHIVTVNHAFEAMSERSAAELTGRLWNECFPNARPIFTEHLRRTLRTGEPGEVELDSSRFPGRTYSAKTFPYAGGVAALIKNVTLERDLRAMNVKADALRTALSQMPELGRVALNVRGVFTQVDEGFTRLTGFTLNDLKTARLIDLVPPTSRHILNQALEISLQGGNAPRISISVLVKQLSEKPFQVSLAPIADDGASEGVLAVFSEV